MSSFVHRSGRAVARPLGLFAGFEAKLAIAALAAALLMITAQGVLAHEFKAGDIEIEHPWARATPAGAKVGGGYLTIGNEGAEPDRLVSVTAEVAGRAEIHEMAVKDGVMTMRPVSGGVEIPAGGTVAMKPGAVHLMLMDLKRPLVAGQSFTGTLTFEHAGTVTVTFAVEAMGATDPGHDAMSQ